MEMFLVGEHGRQLVHEVVIQYFQFPHQDTIQCGIIFIFRQNRFLKKDHIPFPIRSGFTQSTTELLIPCISINVMQRPDLLRAREGG